MRSRSSLIGLVFGPHFLGEVFDLIGARHQRRQIEAEGAFDLAPLPSSGIAFAIRGIAADDQPGIDEAGEMAAQRRRRHAMGADRQFSIGREHDDAGAPLPVFVVGARIGGRQRQRRLLMERQQRMQHR